MDDLTTLRNTVATMAIEICRLKAQLRDANIIANSYRQKVDEIEAANDRDIESLYKEMSI